MVLSLSRVPQSRSRDVVWLLVDTRSVGGIERYIEMLARSFARHGIPVEVVLYQDHGPNPWLDQLAAARASVRVLEGSFRALVTALSQQRPGLLHTHGYKAGVLGRAAARLSGVPVVSTFHSGERAPFPVNAYNLLDAWTSFLGARIAVSRPIQARLPFRSEYIPNYVLTPNAVPGGPLPMRAAFVGRLSEEKGPDVFCALARASPTGVEWHAFGTGPLRGALEAEFGDCVRFHGVVADLSEMWPSIGVLVMPSRYEGLPLAALEALAAGVPVLATRVGGLPSIVEHGQTGWLFEPGDESAALRHLATWRSLGIEEQQAMRSACWGHIRNHFSEANHLPALLCVYKEAGFAQDPSNLR